MKAEKNISERIKRIIFAGISFGLVMLIWSIISWIAEEKTKLFPPLTKVALAVWEWVRSGEFAKDFFTSIWRGLLGLATGAFIGMVLGLLTGRSRSADLFLTPVMNIAKSIPPVAQIPIWITFFGITDLSKVISISVACIFPVWVNAHAGASSIPIEFIRSAKLLSQSRLKIFFRVIFPASLSSIIAGIKISIAISFIMIFVSELAGASSGLGYQISSSHLAYRMDRMFGALIVLGLIASMVDVLFDFTITKIYPWIQLNKINS